MMTESEYESHWPGFLTHKDCNVIIKLGLRRDMEKKCTHKVQKLCKTPRFGRVNKSWLGNLNRELLEDIVNQAKKTSLLIINMMLSLKSHSDTYLTSHLLSIKLLAFVIIMCKSAHRNNSNYISFLVAMYLYSAGAKVDAITLLNHLGFFVLYNSLLKKLRDIKTYSATFIKQQATN